MENIHQVLYAIINLYLKSKTAGSLDPAMLDHIGKFMGTLRKIYTFVEAQQDRNKIKYLFHNNEMQNLLKDCQVGLDQAVEVFAINTRLAIANDIGEMKKTAKTMHEELLELIQTLSDTSTSSDGSSVYLGTNDLKNSSNSFSMLPSKPKIFYGRESELDHIMKMLARQPARIAILGGGGMGKTSLARAVLHHPETSTKFESRFFVSAESVTTSIELAALIGLHIGLDPGKDLTKAVVQYFSRAPSLLLILDNLETVWDPIQSRGGIEEFLSLLTDVEHLTLIITMRGAERPAKVHWTHPFLLPLEPLSDEAAQQTFMDITDNVYAAEDVNQILGFTDNMPLAVDLIAHLSDYEGLSNVLIQWKTEKTALLSVGYDRKSNLDSSITLSLSSPRITLNSKELLSLLSILPDGLSAAQLAHGNLPISNILSCKAALLATSLAYQDSNKQLRSLVPIREHIQQFLPPSKALIQSVCRHFYALLELYQTYNGEQLQPVMNQITLNLRNLQEVLQRGLDDSLSDHTDTISCILSLNSFYRITGRGTTILMNYIHPMLPELDDELNIQVTIEILKSYTFHRPGLDPQQLITKAIVLFKRVKNPHLECKSTSFFKSVVSYITPDASTILLHGRILFPPLHIQFISNHVIFSQRTRLVKFV
ncbi:P-loop containing nucleoside triphosphate hydrolase protein [Mycena olivaceomarginata]|nr:P-loop containing nucleoside triphosphate hydrolase protein [Mycena olivaceomarginata]